MRPRAVSDSTIWSMPSRRRCRLRTFVGSKDPARSRGTSISTGPISVKTVFVLAPFRGPSRQALARRVRPDQLHRYTDSPVSAAAGGRMADGGELVARHLVSNAVTSAADIGGAIRNP